jgi:hypothetical protein
LEYTCSEPGATRVDDVIGVEESVVGIVTMEVGVGVDKPVAALISGNKNANPARIRIPPNAKVAQPGFTDTFSTLIIPEPVRRRKKPKIRENTPR